MTLRNTMLLVLLPLLLSAAGCGSTADVVAALPGQSGAELFAAQGCARCHGADGASGWILPGPDLRGVGRHWTRRDMAAYLADPTAWLGKLDTLKGGSMPGYGHLDERSRLALADHVLSLTADPGS